MKTFVKMVIIIGELMASIVLVPILGGMIACAVTVPVVGLPFLTVIGLYILLCWLLNKALFKELNK